MDTIRTLKGGDVSEQARKSVEKMITEIVDSLVDDFISELNQKGQTINPEGIAELRGVVDNRVSITLKIKAAVNIELVEDMKIPVLNINQADLQEFAGE